MKPERELFPAVMEGLTKELTNARQTIQGFTKVPLGQEELTPRQVKERYGVGVRELQHLERLYGKGGVAEALKAIGELKW